MVQKTYKVTCTIVIFFVLITIAIGTVISVTIFSGSIKREKSVPIVINTWDFEEAAIKAWDYLSVQNKTALDSVEAGCTVCEMTLEQCKKTVGYGGNPDESGETTLDAMVIDGTTMNMGSVGCLRYIKNAISVARRVLENTGHTLLVGDLATNFGFKMDFFPESLQSNESKSIWEEWKNNKCQPNFWRNVSPDPEENCGPYSLTNSSQEGDLKYIRKVEGQISSRNHDTITMLAVDRYGNVAAGASTNGLNHKIAGRVGDTPIPGAGAYADSKVGGASATGDGDIMMRFLPSFLAVEEMRHGASPKDAAKTAVERIATHFPDFFGAIIAVNIYGEYGAACNGMKSFPYCVANPDTAKVVVESIKC